MFLPKAIQDQKKDTLIFQIKAFSNEGPLLFGVFGKWFADGTPLHGVTSSSRHREHLACPQFRGIRSLKIYVPT